MHDLSVPIYVGGKHWGGFRVGYRSSHAPDAVPLSTHSTTVAALPLKSPATDKPRAQTSKLKNRAGMV